METKLLKLVSRLAWIADDINSAQMEGNFGGYFKADAKLRTICEMVELFTEKRDIISIMAQETSNGNLIHRISVMDEPIYTLSLPSKALAMLKIEPDNPKTYFEDVAKETWDFIAKCASNYLKSSGFDSAAQALSENFFSDKWPVDENDCWKRGKNIFAENFNGVNKDKEVKS